MTNRSRWWAAGLAILGLGLAAYSLRPGAGMAQQAQQAQQQMACPKCMVVESEGTNLLVVDTSSNRLYFYTIEPDKEVGSELYLRGSIDLNQIGKPVIKPTVHGPKDGPAKKAP